MDFRTIKKAFLNYFKDKGHKVVPSSPLFIQDDPTLLFTNAGMNQFKRYFNGSSVPEHKRVATVQKCLRAGGKHNDLENVGFTLRHHTFFEMLGNFSFGDYFKEQAIDFAYELVTEIFNVDKKRISISVFKDDEESYKIWSGKDIDKSRIFKLGEKTNFWEMGDIGPCGYSSEIYYDMGKELGTDEFSPDSDRYVELWNIVFMEYVKDTNGKVEELKKKNVDTGMGLERMAAVLQNVHSNFDTDLFTPIKYALVREFKLSEQQKEEKNYILNILSDHLRALTFAIADNILPSNTDRGYVLRRILRRASRYAFELNRSEPVLFKFVPVVIELMKDDYPDMERTKDFIIKTIFMEEEKFLSVVQRGLKTLYSHIGELEKGKKKQIEPEFVFKLYDTYGFPVDITMDTIKKESIEFDRSEFDKLLAKQRGQSRAESDMNYRDKYIDIINNTGLKKTEFTGYENEMTESVIQLIISDLHSIESAGEGDEVIVITERTPFYAESGGQVGDRGIILIPGSACKEFLQVRDTTKTGDYILHHCKVNKGIFKKGQKVILKVNEEFRRNVARNHTCTHLLHYVLRKVLGEFVNQSGSYVSDIRFRFDFNYLKPLSTEQITAIQSEVQKLIIIDLPVNKEEMEYKKALKTGAIALSGEKYLDMVRVVSIGKRSIEFCGGLHVQRTGEIGIFNLISESSIGSGLRRIEANTGFFAYRELMSNRKLIEDLAGLLGVPLDNLYKKTVEIVNQNKELKKQIRKGKQDTINIENILDTEKIIKGYRSFFKVMEDVEEEVMREIIDRIKGLYDNSVVLLIVNQKKSARILSGVSKPIADQINASKLIKSIAKMVSGKGGGRKDFARAGGDRIKDPNKIKREFENFIKKA